MIDDAFSHWQVSGKRLLRANTRHSKYPAVDITAAAKYTREHLDIRDPEGNGFVVPLHAVDEPTPTDEYVVWRPRTGSIRWFDTGFGKSGIKRFSDPNDLAESIIGHRLRFWVPGNLSGVDPNVEFELPDPEVEPTSGLSSAERSAFFSDLSNFVRTEQTRERATQWETYEELGLDGAIRRNQITGPFTHMGDGEDRAGVQGQFFELAQEDDDRDVDLRSDEGLYRNNLCVVDVSAETEHFPVSARILEIRGATVLLRPEWNLITNESTVRKTLQGGADVWIRPLLNPIPYERRLNGIRQVRQTPSKRDLITGNRPVRFSVNQYDVPAPEIELNESQHQALTWADGAHDIVCIHGPPGTGKTRTLTAYIHYAAARGQSVLVTAHSNQAVDNLLVGDSSPERAEAGTLHALAQDEDSPVTIARVGSNTTNAVVREHYLNASPKRASVVAATTSGAAEFDQNAFDVAVVDEATQASRPSTAIVLNCARKLVLAGDHKQLPPYCADEKSQEKELHISLFEHLLNRYGSDISVFLRTQYRMNHEIAEFPNEAFYDGMLETADRNSDWRVDDLKPIMGIDIKGTDVQESVGYSRYNTDEAEAVAKQVKLLTIAGLEPADIGVITAYTGQKSVIRKQLQQLSLEGVQDVAVDTVDSFQGGEREAIVVSFVRSNDNGRSGFLEDPEVGPRRLNVALTRARKRLVLVGNWATLGTVAPHLTAETSCANLYADLESHIRSEDRMLAPKRSRSPEP